ncbi:DNA glycosylase AlkZ-like family protein, partial [Klebsiella pneumoniae]|uniref:DNA glycosylase AlkZ-like family protein n=1 Tax=Klebsiella pneumoniae TaxID=573 RepID=UPI00210DF43B
MSRHLSNEAARRIAISAQGLAGPRPARVGRAALRRAIGRLGVLQIDSVNAFERSHYLPLLARLGAYDRRELDRLLHHDTGR